ncbi:MAG: hypothetical protein K0S33_4224 [Bacteroidetes bacterium]|jgi:hypothetical protein|nr:hypothetical protein [Bacteroidota bacterium]
MISLKKTAVVLSGVTAVFFAGLFFTTRQPDGNKLIATNETILGKRIGIPNGYKRVNGETGSFGAWSRALKLKPDGSKVKLYNGELKNRQDVHAAVLDFDCGTKNLQQCADAVIRMRAEYLYARGKSASIAFHYTSGDLIAFSRWQKGERPVVKGNKVSWIKNKPACSDYDCLKNYLWNVFNYAGTLSVEKETKAITDLHMIEPGDVFVLGGSPGHAVTVLDVAQNEKTGKKIFLLCQSYMPAQEIHILKNFNDPALSPWYSEDFGAVLETPEWDFDRNALRRY